MAVACVRNDNHGVYTPQGPTKAASFKAIVVAFGTTTVVSAIAATVTATFRLVEIFIATALKSCSGPGGSTVAGHVDALDAAPPA